MSQMNSTFDDDWKAHCFCGVHVGEADVGRLTVLDALATQVSRIPDAPFVTEVTQSGAQLRLSYGQFDLYSRRGATWLAASTAIRPGTTLGLIPRNDLISVVAIFSALKVGARIVFLDPLAPPARHSAIAEALEVEAIVRTTPDPHGLAGHLFPELDELPTTAAPDRGLNPADDAFYFGTSGSTATSKIVAQTHRGTAANALAVSQHHSLGPGDRLLSCLPIHHVNGLHFTIMATIFCGSHAILVHGFDTLQYPRLLTEFAPKVASVVPSLLRALTVTWRDGRPPQGFGWFVSAAAPLPREVARTVWERWGARVLQGYGLTETINFSTTLPQGLSEAVYCRQILDAAIPSIGVAVHGNEIAVLDNKCQPVPYGQEGELCVRGHNVMDRYVGNPEATAEAFRHGWFHTGDLGFLRTDAETGSDFVVITGRAKNVAKVRGESVSLEEMERVLLNLLGVSDAACAAFPDRMLGEAIMAALVVEDSVSDDMVLNHLRGTFPEVALPRRLLRVQAVPRTPTGKILRPQLRSHLESLFGLG
jgi:acyl-CoA synthetase (AMP-forming)/AMP-acid ligase II